MSGGSGRGVIHQVKINGKSKSVYLNIYGPGGKERSGFGIAAKKMRYSNGIGSQNEVGRGKY